MANEKRIPSGTKKRRLLIGTVLLLAITFIILIALFIAIAELLPAFTGKCVAIVDINMPLTVEGRPVTLMEMGYPSSEQLADSIRKLNEREDVGAVLFVINSEGGSVVATHEVYDAVNELEKPKVAYFREVAASGAYYVASGTDYIISEPTALTGNIGVVATVISMEGLFEKLGINATVITSGDHKDIGSPFRNMTGEEMEIMQSIVDEVFQDFRNTVVENRGDKLNRLKFDEVTDGRIMTGKQALEVGLVDDVGNKDDALMKAAELGGIEAETAGDVRVCYVSVTPTEGGLLSAESFIGSIGERLNLPSLFYK
jgi:protease-4